jgi:hypothetical protein
MHVARRLSAALGNVFSFDARDKDATGAIREIMHSHGIPLGTDDTAGVWVWVVVCESVCVSAHLCVCVCVGCGWVRSSTLGTDDTAGVWLWVVVCVSVCVSAHLCVCVCWM